MKTYKIFNFGIIVIFLSIIISLLNANNNIKNFDKNVINENNKSVHLMIKNDNYRYFSHGYEIKEQLKENLNYFETGRNNFTKYLYPRIIAFYYLVFDYDLYEDSNKDVVKIGIHKNFLIIQIFFYYLSILFLFFQLKHKIDDKYLIFILIFLCIEPTIFQYHGSFWSESIFFSLQIIIMGFVLGNNSSYLRFFLLGIILSLLALQRTNGFYYIIPIIIYFYIVKDINFLKKILALLTGFSLIILTVGYENYIKSGKFFIIPIETKSVLHAYVVPNILSNEELKKEEIRFFEKAKSEKIIFDKKKLENIHYSRYSFIFCENFDDKKENLNYLKICKYFDERAKSIILENPIKSFKYVFNQSLSFSLLNPFHIYSDNRFLSGSEYYNSKLHKKILPYRVIYTILIYLIFIVGIFELYRNKENKILIYTLISSIYFFIILSWHGNNRYFTPILIYCSIFFGYGIIGTKNLFAKYNIKKLYNK